MQQNLYRGQRGVVQGEDLPICQVRALPPPTRVAPRLNPSLLQLQNVHHERAPGAGMKHELGDFSPRIREDQLVLLGSDL